MNALYHGLLSSLKETTQEIPLIEMVETQMGGDWGTEKPQINSSKIICLRGTDILESFYGNFNKAPLRFISELKLPKKALHPLDIVVEVSGGSSTQSTGRATLIGNKILSSLNESIICSNFCRVLRPKEKFSFYLYQTIKNIYEQGIMFLYENGTTGIKNLDLKKLLSFETVKLPSSEKLDSFNFTYQVLWDQIVTNTLEIQKLEKIRNSLLPKLLSGEIEL